MDYLELTKAARKIKDNVNAFPEARVAVLGDSSTQQLCQMLRALLDQQRIFPVLYEAEYKTIDQEVLNPDSGFNQFSAQWVLLHTSMQELRHQFDATTDQERKIFAEQYFRKLQLWWSEISKSGPGRIIQNLYALPLEKPFGNYTNRLSDSFYAQVTELNRLIVAAAQTLPNFFLNDVEHISSRLGKQAFFDEKIWIHAKIFCAVDCLPQVAKNITTTIAAGCGRMTKCVVLDCDNTLWGGTIGDDGLDGIALGPEGIGQAFVRFQNYLKSLKKAGVLLAVCSKNDHDTAVDVFRRHPDMVLREEDIALFVVNWNNKSDNLRHIVKTLNLSEEAFVFIDDSPFERNLVRAALPSMCVPEMPEDPVDYPAFLDGLHLFETLSVSEEDEQRTHFYQHDLQRQAEQIQFQSIDDYLRSLNMEARFARFDRFHLPRVAQLISRSNQFNLTTQRHSEADCAVFMTDHEHYDPFFISLKDKFGDSGLIGVVILKYEGSAAFIDTWLMSCRVLLRGVEQFSMNKVVDCARGRNCEEICGMYIPTAKNKMVADFYGKFGFEKIEENSAGLSRWKLKTSDYIPQGHFIQEKKGEAWPAEALLKS